MLKLTVLGSGTGWIRLDRNAPGYLVSLEDEFTLLLDCGYGVFKQILKIGRRLEEVSAIFVSHFHPDHVSDLIPFFFATRYSLGYKRILPLELYAAQGFLTFFELLKKAFNNWIEPPSYLLKITELPLTEGYEFSMGPFKARTSPVKHNLESLALRLEYKDKVLVYSGDTGYCKSLINLAREADLLIVECSNSEDLKVEIHLSPEEIGMIARDARVKTLLVSHFYPHSEKKENLDIIKKYFEGNVILAEDFLTLEV